MFLEKKISKMLLCSGPDHISDVIQISQTSLHATNEVNIFWPTKCQQCVSEVFIGAKKTCKTEQTTSTTLLAVGKVIKIVLLGFSPNFWTVLVAN